ncbi:MAG TPA: anthranilate phosphoribosyltransferase [Longimicrobiales bacterium]
MSDGPSEPAAFSLAPFLLKIASRQDLTADEAEAAFDGIMEGRAPAFQVAAFLASLRAKGETPQEVAGGVRALRRAMLRVPVSNGESVLDTCGTGGGSFTTFNISTAAALLAAGAGVPVAKHGNRSFTSRSGSADVLEALGVAIDLPAGCLADVLREAGIVFMFAPRLHPAMRHVAPVRRELGIPTIMNLLGPLTNPAGARRQLLGVAEPALLELIATALLELGHEHALVVHGAPGLDELSPVGPSEVVEVRDGRLLRYRFDPERQLGWTGLDASELAGGDPAENARLIEAVLEGRGRRAARAAVLLNAGAALYLAGRASSIEEGVHEATTALDAGAGWEALQRLRAASRAAAERAAAAS